MARKLNKNVELPPYMKLSWDRHALIAHVAFTPTEADPVGRKQFDEVIDVLQSAGLKNIDEDAVKAALKKVEPGVPIPVARGVPPRQGADGYVEYKVKVDVGRIELNEDDEGRVDYRELNLFDNVETGQLLAVLVPPTKGKPGLDVFGQPIPAAEGKPAKLVVDKNVKVTDNGTKAVATADGMPCLSAGRLEVLPVYQIKGDVAYATGNIRFSGDVHISGSVLEEFVVEANDNVFIERSIEKANVSAGLDIEVGWGITGREGALVSAGQNLKTKFANSATLRAGDTITVEGELLWSDCKAAVIEVDGFKSTVMGGTLHAYREMRLREVGDAGSLSKTVLKLSPPDETVIRIQEVVAELECVRKKISDSKKQLARYRNAEEKFRNRVLAEIKDLSEQEQTLIKEGQSLQNAVKESINGTITVRENIHHGTTVQIWDAEFEIVQSLEAAKFRYVNGKIEVTSSN